ALVAAGLGALVAAAVPAAASLSAQAIPGRLTLTLKAGETVARDVVLTNSGDGAAGVHVRYVDWSLHESGNVSFLAPAGRATSLAGAVRFEPADFSLQPGESGRVQVTLTMPADGPPTHWGALLSEVRPAIPVRTALG